VRTLRRIVPVRDRGLARVPLAIAVLAAVALPACQAATQVNQGHAGGPQTQTYQGHGVSFSFPAGWSVESPHGGTTSGNLLWGTSVGPGTPDDTIQVDAFNVKVPVTAQNFDAANRVFAGAIQQAGATLEGTGTKTTMAGLLALLFRVTSTTGGTRIQSRIVIAFSGPTEYFVNCQYTPAKTAEVEQGCHQVVGSFRVGKASATQTQPGAPAG
jgi:hypothetical protein